MIAWAAATGGLSAEPVLLFLIIFFWPPPHFWPLPLYRANDYALANLPMLPVVAGRSKTQKQSLIYTLILVPVSILPWAAGFVGVIYGAFAMLAGARFIRLAWQLQVGDKSVERRARRLFAFSIVYLFALFAVFLADKQVAAYLTFNPGSRHAQQVQSVQWDARLVAERTHHFSQTGESATSDIP